MKGIKGFLGCVIVLIFSSMSSNAHEISQIVGKVKPSVVGIGIYAPLSRPSKQLRGTGFAIADGTIIATNYHVIDLELDPNSKQELVVFIGAGQKNLASVSGFGFGVTSDTTTIVISELANITTTGMTS